MKKILYFDMDGVVANFDKAIKKYCPEIDLIDDREKRSLLVDEVCEANTTIFEELELIEGAKEAVLDLANIYEVYFLSTPMWNVPNSFTGKRLWLEKHFGSFATKRLILTHRKDLNIGHFLVDDRLKNGAGEFIGVHVHFGTEKFPDWPTTLQYLKEQSETIIDLRNGI